MTTTDLTATAALLDWAASYRLDDRDAAQVRYLLLDHAANALGGLDAESTRTDAPLRRHATGREPGAGRAAGARGVRGAARRGERARPRIRRHAPAIVVAPRLGRVPGRARAR